MPWQILKQSGFTLIEGMISAAILGAGLLALSGMQAISFSRNVDANELTRVTNLTADMMERIQFNRRNVAAYNNIDTFNVATQPPSSQAMARGDYAQWQILLNTSGLTGVRGQINVAPVGPVTPPLNQSSVTVTISWRGSVRNDTSVTRNKSVTMATIIAPE
jgi:type IV pilus assembly protein PilV